MFRLKPTHKVVKDYYAEVHKLTQLGAVHEGAVAPAFANLLRAAAQPFGWTLGRAVRAHRTRRAGHPRRRRAAGQFQAGARLLGGEGQR